MTKVLSGQRVRQGLVRGVSEVARTVGITYGPCGRTVMLDRPSGILTTCDGVAVALEIRDEGVVGLGNQLIQQACRTVNGSVGDGTSTVALLVEALLLEGHKRIVSGYAPQTLAQEIREAKAVAIEEMLPILVARVEDQPGLCDIALHTMKGDREMAETLSRVAWEAGSHGMISIEEGKGVGIEIDHKTGCEIQSHWESADLTSNESWVQERVLLACVSSHATEHEQIAPILQQAADLGLPLLIVSDGIYGPALHTCVLNAQKGVLPIMAVRCPGDGPLRMEYLKDIAALSGATIFDPGVVEWKNFEGAHLGSVQRAEVKRNCAVLTAFDDKFSGIVERATQLEGQFGDSDHENDLLRERIAKLTEGFFVVRVGGVSESARKERRGRVEDGLHAVRAALEGGVVTGGGMAYRALGDAVREVLLTPGAQVLSHSLDAPLHAIVENSGYAPGAIFERLKAQAPSFGPRWKGFDAAKGEFRDFRADPIIADPASVIREAVETAVSVATTMLLAEVAIFK